jgi:aminomethyltransferase
MWDVAAERQVELIGPDAARLAQLLSARDIAGTVAGQGRYVPLCNHDGILINDPVLLKLAEDRFWLSIADSDIGLWAEAVARQCGLDVQVFEPDASPLAIQGPKAVDLAVDLFGDWVRQLKYFWFRETSLQGIPLILARSGWSKQGGFELYLLDAARGCELWDLVKAAGRRYGIGPGAPSDRERLESGLLSYGGDCRHLTRPANPFEVGLGHLVDLESGGDFIGRDALCAAKRAGIERRRAGFIIEGPPVAFPGHPLDVELKGEPVGFISNAVHSWRLERNIAVGLIPSRLSDDTKGLTVDLGNGPRALQVTGLPFIGS